MEISREVFTDYQLTIEELIGFHEKRSKDHLAQQSDFSHRKKSAVSGTVNSQAQKCILRRWDTSNAVENDKKEKEEQEDEGPKTVLSSKKETKKPKPKLFGAFDCCRTITSKSCEFGVTSLKNIDPGLLQPGCLIKIQRSKAGIKFFHWAVIVEENTALHVTVHENEELCNCPDEKTFVEGNNKVRCPTCRNYYQYVARSDSLEPLVGKDKIKIDNSFDKKHSPLERCEIVARANSLRGPVKYDTKTLNCEHFVTWCRYGIPLCFQSTYKWYNDNDYLEALKPGVHRVWNSIKQVGARVSCSRFQQDRQTLDHVLQDCSVYSWQRFVISPKEARLQDKLWLNGNKLYVTKKGLNVYAWLISRLKKKEKCPL